MWFDVDVIVNQVSLVGCKVEVKNLFIQKQLIYKNDFFFTKRQITGLEYLELFLNHFLCVKQK